MPLTDNLVAYYKLDEPTGLTRVDLVNAYNLTDHGTVAHGTGKLGGCAVFSGANWLAAADEPALRFTGDITIGCWVWIDPSATGVGQVVGKAGANLEYRLLYQQSSGKLIGSFSFDGSTEHNVFCDTFGAVPTATWVYAVMGYASAAGKIFIRVNATARDESPVTGPPAGGFTDGLGVGAYAAGANPIIARVDDLAIWQRAVSDAEIDSVYNGGTGMELMPTPPPVAAQCVVTTEPPSSVIRLEPFGLAVSIESSDARLVTDYVGNVTVALDANPGSATLGGTTTVAVSGGIATFTDLTLDVADAGYTLTATSGALTADTSAAFAVTPALKDDLVLSCKLDEPAGATRADDASGYDLADLRGDVGRSPGKVHFAADFDPLLAPALAVASNADLQFSGAKSFVVWVKVRAGTVGGIVSKWGATGALQEFLIYYAVSHFTAQFVVDGVAYAISSTTLGTPAIDTWYMIACGYKESNDTVWMSVNNQGAPDALALGGGSHAFAPGTAPLVIGSNGDSLQYLDGLVDNLDIWNRDLSLGDVAALWNGGAGLDLYPAAAATKLVVTAQPTVVVRSAPFALEVSAESAGGVLDTGYTGAVTVAFGSNPGGATLGGTLTVNAVDGVATFADLTIDAIDLGYTLTVTSGSLTSATTAAIEVTSELLYRLGAYWPLDEATGTTRVDSVGGLDAIDHGTVALGTGVLGGDAVFNGSNYLLVADDPAIRFAGSFTLTCWFRVNSVDFGGSIGMVGKIGEYFLVYFPDVQYVRGYFSFDGGTTFATVNSISAGVLAVGERHFAAISYDADAHEIWVSIDGGAKDRIAVTGTPPGNLTGDFGIGGHAGGDQQLNGELEKVAIYQRSLSSADLSSLFNGGTGLAYPFTGTVRPLAVFSAGTIHQGGVGTLTVEWLGAVEGTASLITPSATGFVFSPSSATLAATPFATATFPVAVDLAATLGAHTIAVANDQGYAIASIGVTVVAPEFVVADVEIDPTGDHLTVHAQLAAGGDVTGITRVDPSAVAITVDGVTTPLDDDDWYQYQDGQAYAYITLRPEVDVHPDSVVTLTCGDAAFGNLSGSTGRVTDLPVPVKTTAQWWDGARARRADVDPLLLGYNSGGDSVGQPILANLSGYMGAWGFREGSTIATDNRGNLTTVAAGTAERLLWFYGQQVDAGTYCMAYREVEGPATLEFVRGDAIAPSNIRPMANPPAGKAGFLFDLALAGGVATFNQGQLSQTTTKAIDRIEIYGPNVMTGLSDYPVGVKRINPQWAARYADKNIYMMRDLNLAPLNINGSALPDVDRINAQYFGNAYGDNSNLLLHAISIGPVPDPYLSEWGVANDASHCLFHVTFDADLPADLAGPFQMFWSWDGTDNGSDGPGPAATTYGGTAHVRTGDLETCGVTGARTIWVNGGGLSGTPDATPATLSGTTAIDTHLTLRRGVGLSLQDEIDLCHAMNVRALHMRVGVAMTAADLADTVNFLNRPHTPGVEGGGLDPAIPLRWEMENEVWNLPFSFTNPYLDFLANHARYLFDHGGDPSVPVSPPGGFQFAAMRMAVAAEIARPLCAAAGRTFYSSLGAQGGFPAHVNGDFFAMWDTMVAGGHATGSLDYLLVAPYFDLNMAKIINSPAFGDRLSPDGAVTIIRNQLGSFLNPGYFSQHQSYIDASVHSKDTRIAGYEGIMELIRGHTSNWAVDADASNMSAQMYHACKFAFSLIEDGIQGSPGSLSRPKSVCIFQGEGGFYNGNLWYDYKNMTQLAGLAPPDSTRGQALNDWMATTPTPTATKLAITAQPNTPIAEHAAIGLVVSAETSGGSVVAGYTGSVSVALASNPGGATLDGTTTVAAVAGIATFTGLALDKAGVGYILVATAAGLASATTAAVTVTATPTVPALGAHDRPRPLDRLGLGGHGGSVGRRTLG
jgi:hypothetical protein